MAFENFSFNIDEIARKVWHVIVRIITVPVSYWNNLPKWVKGIFLSILVFITLIVLILIIKKRDAWRTKDY